MIAVLEMLEAYLDHGEVPDDPAMRTFLNELWHGGAKPQPIVYTKDYASSHWAEAGFETLIWVGPGDVRGLAGWLRANQVAAVITGTSDIDDDTDQQLWQASARCGIQAYAFLDGAVNPELRFITRGRRGPRTRLKFFGSQSSPTAMSGMKTLKSMTQRDFCFRIPTSIRGKPMFCTTNTTSSTPWSTRSGSMA